MNEPGDPQSIERGVRQILANKVSGTLAGIWLLVPEHLRLGTWDLLKGWSGCAEERVEPRIAMQLVHEAALCHAGKRRGRSLSQKGFELANGLSFIASDFAVHKLLNEHTVKDSEMLQVQLGLLRRASGHFKGQLLAIDPHHLHSYTKRQTRRHKHKQKEQAIKTLQTYFCLDVETAQPVAFTIASSSKSVSRGAPELFDMAGAILQPRKNQSLILADKEHYCWDIFKYVVQNTGFDLVTPMPLKKGVSKEISRLPEDSFSHRWAGFATAKLPVSPVKCDIDPLQQIVQRCGENGRFKYSSFVTTKDSDEVTLLTVEYPKRWHVEEFFLNNQDLGWNRAGTMNLNIRYGQMTMALIAQAVVHQLRQRLGEPYSKWDAGHFADGVLSGLDGDIRVVDDTIVVTYYNAPNADLLKLQYENLPKKLEKENVDPHIPWLYDFKLDFRFK